MRGEAVIEAEPELATLSITVEAQGPDRQSALDLLTARAHAVSSLVRQLERGIEKSETSRLHVYPVLDGKKTEKVRRYVGQASTSVTVHDFSVLSDLVVGATAIELASIDGPGWQLRATSPVFRDARIAAAADALSRARDYASAFGAEVVGLIEIADEGMSHQPPQPMGYAVPLARQAGGSAQERGGESFDLAPARQQVSGRLEARFSLSQPDLTPPGQPNAVPARTGSA